MFWFVLVLDAVCDPGQSVPKNNGFEFLLNLADNDVRAYVDRGVQAGEVVVCYVYLEIGQYVRKSVQRFTTRKATRDFMFARMRTVWFVLLGLLFASPITTAAEDDGVKDKGVKDKGNQNAAGLLVDSEYLRSRLSSDDLRILDVRPAAEYLKKHIPGAININVAEWKKLEFDDLQGWAETVGPLGIDVDTHVVVYGNKLSDVGRAWWLLTYVGVQNVSILDGGYDLWTKNDGPTDSFTPEISAKDFKPNFQTDRLERIDSLKKSLHSSTVNVLDTRSAEEFDAGNIPGSTNLEWKELVDSDGRFKTKAQLQTLFQARGIAPSEAAVCY